MNKEFKLNDSLKWSFKNFLWEDKKLRYIIDFAINRRFTDIYITQWKTVQYKKNTIITSFVDKENDFDPMITQNDFQWFLKSILPESNDLWSLNEILSELKSFDYWIWYNFLHRKKTTDWKYENINEKIRLRLNFENTIDWIMITVRPLIDIWLTFEKLTSLDWAITKENAKNDDDSTLNKAIEELEKMNKISDLIKSDFSRTSWLILVTWTTWSWKSTIVTSILEYILKTTDKHVLTLEDPIEFILKQSTWKVTQIEVWTHIESFSTGIKWSKRQNPDIVYIQEIRDSTSAKALMELLWSWVLVITTLHTWSVSETIDRLVWLMSDHSNEEYIRTFVSRQLISIINQKLIYIKKKNSDWEEKILTKWLQEYLHINWNSRKSIKDNKYYVLESLILESLPPNKSITRTMWNLYLLWTITMEELLKWVTNLDSLESLIKDQYTCVTEEDDIKMLQTFFWIKDISNFN